MRSTGLGSVRWWAYAILLAGVALGFDAADRRIPFSLLGNGLLDEVGHLATGALGLLVLACLIDVPRWFYVAGLIASVAIDLDHIPLYPGLLGTRTSARSRIPLPPCLSLPVPRLLAGGTGPCWPE